MRDMTETLDASGLLCPLPVLKLRKRMMSVPSGGTLRMITDDPAAIIDIPHFCAEAGHHVIESTHQDATVTWVLRKG